MKCLGTWGWVEYILILAEGLFAEDNNKSIVVFAKLMFCLSAFLKALNDRPNPSNDESSSSTSKVIYMDYWNVALSFDTLTFLCSCTAWILLLVEVFYFIFHFDSSNTTRLP